jgi:hypothetical protein
MLGHLTAVGVGEREQTCPECVSVREVGQSLGTGIVCGERWGFERLETGTAVSRHARLPRLSRSARGG